MSLTSRYLTGFSNELLDLVNSLQLWMPSDVTLNILNLYPKLSAKKLSDRYRKLISPCKPQLTAKDVTLFDKPVLIMPELDISFYWQNLDQSKRDVIWKTMSKLLIHTNIIHDMDNTSDVSSEIQPAPNVIPQEKTVMEVNPFVGIGQNGEDISIDTMLSEMDLGKSQGNPIMNAIQSKLNMNEIRDELKQMSGDDIVQITNGVRDVIGLQQYDPQVSTMMDKILTGIGDELKTADLGNGNLFDSMLKIAEKVSGQLAPGQQCSTDKLMETTQNIMKTLGLPSELNDMLDLSDPTALLGMLNGLSKP
jgi:hypothetical protein